eukprot:NODE_3505_length_394_cov_428.400000_g2959_i0.p1 GENE.NODE_3505_length_394_cov_428.400000_g2959_i0~~NODE_3505_length_394_cov_428.400000_g2959_i0.p1  ORF type:complete len:94 (+),score=24.35 NODE_3505_length_394_cov_428.400000_g2959_i0:25-282(+)
MGSLSPKRGRVTEKEMSEELKKNMLQWFLKVLEGCSDKPGGGSSGDLSQLTPTMIAGLKRSGINIPGLSNLEEPYDEDDEIEYED